MTRTTDHQVNTDHHHQHQYIFIRKGGCYSVNTQRCGDTEGVTYHYCIRFGLYSLHPQCNKL